MSDLSSVSPADLLQWLANAKKTAAQALGHNKTAMNDRLVRLYAEELTRRKMEIPPNDELYSKGVFNGAGST
jgi:hypothetical protein